MNSRVTETPCKMLRPQQDVKKTVNYSKSLRSAPQHDKLFTIVCPGKFINPPGQEKEGCYDKFMTTHSVISHF